MANASFAGYEYQIAVTVWIALDLMLAKGATDKIAIEPKSLEDVEAAIHDADVASLDVDSLVEGSTLVVQIKSRSTAPWSSANLADVLLGVRNGHSTPGAGRPRPLSMLRQDRRMRYVFVTNEGLSQTLRPYECDGLLQSSDMLVLPPHARAGLTSEEQQAIAPHISLCPGLTVEVLSARTNRILATHGHIAREAERKACVRDLEDAVRIRMSTHTSGSWTKVELLEIVRRHGGSALSTQALDDYVRPRSFDKIRLSLQEQHAVVISGPSGTGKTMTADIIEGELRVLDFPYSVVTEEGGPSRVRGAMNGPDPVLFHLRDPWGSNRVEPSADPWVNELPKLLALAGPNRKFLVTSRSDILQTAGHTLAQQLERYTVPIDISDYGQTRLARIYDLKCLGLAGHALDLAQAYRVDALKVLRRPYELDRFIFTLMSEPLESKRTAFDIIKDSQIDAISSVVASQVEGMGPDGASCAAVVWAMLKVRDSLSVKMASTLRRLIRREDAGLALDLEGFLDFMMHGRNLKKDGHVLSFYHPRVEDGLRMAIEANAASTEHVLSVLVEALVGSDGPEEDWGVETALKVLKEVKSLANVYIALSKNAQARLDPFLERKALCASYGRDFPNTMDDLAKFGSASHPSSLLARLLTGETSGGTKSHGFGRKWQMPPLGQSTIAVLHAGPHTGELTNRFIREALHISEIDYAEDFVELVRRIDPDTAQSFDFAVREMLKMSGVCNSVEAIVTGACGGETPNFEPTIERIALASAEVDEWMEISSGERRQAKEHEIDAAWADHILEQPGERYYISQAAMQVVAELRRSREGIGWLAGHPSQGLLVEALVEGVDHAKEAPTTSYVRELISLAHGWNKVRVWRMASKHRAGLDDLIKQEICSAGLEHAEQRELLLQTFAAGAVERGDDPIAIMPVGAMESLRRIELIFDVMQSGSDLGHTKIPISERQKRSSALAARFDPAQAGLAVALSYVLAGEPVRNGVPPLPTNALDLLESLLPGTRPDLAAPLIFLGSAAGSDCASDARRVMGSDDAGAAFTAVQAMTMRNDERAVDIVREALVHPHYKVRRLAMKSLLEDPTPLDHDLIGTMAKDSSADVRLAWATAMGKLQWAESVDDLGELLGDTRNYDPRPPHFAGPSWASFAVARAAARALGGFVRLPESAIDGLLVAIGDRTCADPMVACQALTALTFQDDPRIDASIMAALRAPAIPSAPGYRPLSQAAAWALLDRAALGLVDLAALDGEELLRLCQSPKSAIAGPAIAAVAYLDGSLSNVLAVAFRAQNKVGRLELLSVASVAAGRQPPLGAEGPVEILQKLGRTGQAGLGAQELGQLTAWGAGLRSSSDIESVTALLATEVFAVATPAIAGDPRTYDLPKRTGMISLRSLSPDAEEVDSDAV